MGNKKKLIGKGLVDLFPKDINIFIDVFAGSSVISMNTKANKYYVNDLDSNLVGLYNLFKKYNSGEIISHINKRIEEYELAKERTSHKTFEDDRVERYKKAYTNFRDYYNRNKNDLDFYTLMFYSFSQQFRFNSKGDFNMPCGNDCFSEVNEQYIHNGCNFFSKDNVKILNRDYKTINFLNLTDKDFVYFDPPYLNTTATYNENEGWNIDDEEYLYKVCEILTKHNIKFGMSNVYENKGIINQKLIDWCNTNNFNVYSFDKFTYSACGRGSAGTKEVYICNYKIK